MSLEEGTPDPLVPLKRDFDLVSSAKRSTFSSSETASMLSNMGTEDVGRDGGRDGGRDVGRDVGREGGRELQDNFT